MEKVIESRLKKHDVLLKAMKGYLKEGLSGTEPTGTVQDKKGVNVLKTIQEDPLVRACYEITVAYLFKNGYEVLGADKEKLNKLRFDRFMRKYAWQLLMYKASFTEIVKNANNEVTKLCVYDTPTFEILVNEHGEPEGYAQTDITQNPEQPKVIKFELNEIFYSNYNEMDSTAWGHNTLLTLKETIDLKHLIEGFINWLFASNQFRTVIKVPEDFNEDNLKKYMQLMIDTMNDPKKFLVLAGEHATHEPLRAITGFTELLNILDYCRAQILALLQLPPLNVGILGTSNRSNAEYQVRYSFYTMIEYVRGVIKDEVEQELFPMLGFKDAKLKFNPLDDKSANDYLDMAQKLVNMGGKPEIVNKWLVERIPDLPKDILFTQEQKLEMQVESKLDKNSDIHPSRQKTSQDFASGAEVTKGKKTQKELGNK
jgi:hypothetical protein